MQYHARALTVNGVDVDLVGEAGTELPAWLMHPRLHVHRLDAHRGVSGVFRATRTLFALLRGLASPDLVLVQTPPAIPALAVSWLWARRRGARLVFDWHNLGWSLLAQRGGRWAALAVLARRIEEGCARLADAHLTVSSALSDYLRREQPGRTVSTLLDRPAESFIASVGAGMSMRQELVSRAGLPAGTSPAIVLSPSSWTTDEHMLWLLDVADRLETLLAARLSDHQILIVASGNGPSRKVFEGRARARSHGRVHVVTAFVSSDAYPSLVASADVGVCLHQSSSGLDIPMKVLDFFGGGVPVCALDYGGPIRETVIDGVNGRLFRDAHELADILFSLFDGWPAVSPALRALRAGVETTTRSSWTDGWLTEAAPLLGVESRP